MIQNEKECVASEFLKNADCKKWNCLLSMPFSDEGRIRGHLVNPNESVVHRLNYSAT